MRKVFLLTAFSLLTPLVLVLCFSLLNFSFAQRNTQMFVSNSPRVAFAALPVASGLLKADIVSHDARVAVVEDFFKRYNSTLLPFANEVVTSADKYDLDYRLVPAIAMQESNLCKKAPKDSYNCWGFGIYGKNVTKFTNYYEAIETVTKTLAMQYKAKGLETPEQIMSKYTPSNNGAWADSVKHFMEQLTVSL